VSATCPVCQREQIEGLLCHACTCLLERDLGDVAALVAELDVTLSRQAKIGDAGKSGAGWARERLPIGVGAMDPRWVLSNVLTTWARDVSNETWLPDIDIRRVRRDPDATTEGPFCLNCAHRSCQRIRMEERREAPPLAAQAAWLLLREVAAIRKHPAVIELIDEIADAIRLARRTVDRPADRKFFGTCYAEQPGEDGEPVVCTEEIWANPHAEEVTCKVCGITHEIAERREWLLDKAEDMILTPREASQYIGGIGKMTIGHQKIRNYLDRGRITERPSPDGVKRLRLGDLLDVLRDDAARHDARAS